MRVFNCKPDLVKETEGKLRWDEDIDGTKFEVYIPKWRVPEPIVLAIIGGAVVFVHNLIWGEQEGFTKTDDCRNSVVLKEDSAGTWFKKFTCTVKKTKSGKIMSGVCVSIVTEGPVCQTVYTYFKKAEVNCSDLKFPFIGYDDLCHSEYQP